MTDQFHSIHFVGIKGIGMSALAIIAKQRGYAVTGSDVAEDFISDPSLQEAGIAVQVGFVAEHIQAGIDLVVVGAAFGEDNPEVIAARQQGITVWLYSELLGYLTRQTKTLAVAGTHGKTTTTSLISFMLYAAGYQPGYLIGTGEVPGLPSHGAAGKGELFIVEADDYKRAPQDNRPKFLDLSPYAAIITSIEHDHPDMYPALSDCIQAFYELALRVDTAGFLVVNGDDPNITQLRTKLSGRRLVTFGNGPQNDYRIVSRSNGTVTVFELQRAGQSYGPFQLNLQGQHNLMNAAAAVVLLIELGIPVAVMRENLPKFQAVERRYQLIGKVGEVIVIDDYAHHPTAVRLTLEAARKQYPERPIWCLFQSHTYSRTKALLDEFAQAFTAADTVLVTDIFASAREQEATITTDSLVNEIRHHHKNVQYVAKDQLVAYLNQHLPANAVVVTMGAGDIYKVGRAFVDQQK